MVEFGSDESEACHARPLFFLSGTHNLYGIRYMPEAPRNARTAVLLCPPIGDSQIRCHGIVREVALECSRQGMHALRFDYYGCGDSAGNLEEATLEIWQADVEAALGHLREVSRPQIINVIGWEIGALLAARHGLRRHDICRLVLVDPVVQGADYVRQGLKQHALWRQRASIRVQPRDRTGCEMNGFALSPVLRAELENVDLLASPAAPCEQACILSRNDALAHSLARRLEFLKCSVRLVDLPDDVAGLRIVRIVVGALQTM